MVLGSGAEGAVLLVARVLFGGLLAFQGVNHFLDHEGMTGYAAAKGVPAPGVGVVASGLMLIGGGLGIAAGVFPAVAAGALVVFFVVTTPTMHDFWAAGEEEAQNEMIHFIKNVELLAGALVFLAISGTEWSYAVGVGL